MNTVLTLLSMFGGLAMFLYGMEVMGDGLKQSSGTALKRFLGKLTQNDVMGVLTGTIVTGIIQSSTATIVLTVGLIGAGILNLRQAVSIVMGANIGTTVTAQIIRLMDLETGSGSLLALFKPDTLAPIALIVGIILIMFVKKASSKNVGTICLGFGLLFSGLMLMTDSVKPLAQSEAFVNALSYFTDSPLMSILVGLALTVIVQSSSAMVGILQALSATGLITFNLVYPLIMGINLGTCVTTALVCSIGSSKDAKRTGVVHIIFNTVGTVFFMIVMTILKHAGFFPALWTSVSDSGAIANFQTLFNLITAILLVPFTNLLVKISCRIIRDDPAQENPYPELCELDRKLMISPIVALTRATSSIGSMARIARDNVVRSLRQFDSYDDNRSVDINICEDHLDRFADSADNFLIELSRSLRGEKEERQLTMLMQCVPNLERIGDYATNFDELAARMSAQKISFSESAKKEMDLLCHAVLEIIDLTVDVLENDNEDSALRIEPLEEVIDDMTMTLRNRHTARLCQGICSVDSGLIFLEALTQLERAADQCSSIALLSLGRSNEEILRNHHLYLQKLHTSFSQPYLAEMQRRREQYLAPLDDIQF